MESIGKRLERLEEQITVRREDELRERASREFLRRLADEEIAWLDEPIHEAQMLVECPLHGPGCHCTNEPRGERAREEYPELHEEFELRSRTLLDRKEEIMARENQRKETT
jgi:hypothetical protein